MKLRVLSIFGATVVAALCALCLVAAGCGSSGTANTITIGLSASPSSTLILGQSATITAVVTGSTDVNVKWGNSQKNYNVCTYTTTTFSSTGTPTTSAVTNCPSDNSLGSVSNEQITGTATYLAPATLPDPTKFPGLQIQIWACSEATPIKCNDVPLAIDSGVSVTITPVTAAVPTNEKQPFIALLANDLKAQGVTWLVTQQSPPSTSTSTNTNQYASLTTCTVSGNATGCGSIDQSGVYTAPAAIPTNTTPQNVTNTAPTDCTTPQILTIVATSKEDPTRFALGTITITQGGPIQFNGITPTIAPQGAEYWDIFFNAPNISSSSTITLTDSNNGHTTLTSGTGQMKILFPVATTSTSTTTTTAPGCGSAMVTTSSQTSTGARLRLLAGNLANSGPFTVTVKDPAAPVTQCTGSPLPSGCTSSGTFTYNVLPVRPTVTSSSPNDIVQDTSGAASTTNTNITIDGGYFGDTGNLVTATFGNTLLGDVNNAQGTTPLSFAKQLVKQFPSNQVNTGLPGLYSLSVARSDVPPPAVGDLAVFPSYLTDPPLVGSSPILTGTGTFPSAVDIDPGLGVLVVAETGSTGNPSANPPIPAVPGAVQFYSIGNGTLTPIGSPVPVGISPGPSVLPTGLSVNRNNHTVAVVNYGEQSITVLPIPGAPVQAPGTPFNFNIAGLLQGAVNPAPLPYSIGVDPDTNFGIVAYSSTSSSSASNLGFLLDLNPNGTSTCLSFTGAPPNPPCAFAQVTLNTGQYPQVAMARHGHLAFVSPGGSGALRGVDVTKPSTSIGITSLTLAAGIVTVTTSAPATNNILVPGNAGSVLITGVPTTNAAGNTNFNGVYTANVISDTSFSFISSSLSSGTVTITNPITGTCSGQTAGACVYFSTPNLIFGGLSQTTQGIAINPISNTAALVDADSTSAQLYVVNNLDQSTNVIGFQQSCTFYYTSGCPGGPELLGSADVAWQPYSNAIVSYNPGVNQVSVTDPSTNHRYAFACELKANTAAGCIVNPATESQNGGPHCQAGTLAVCTQDYLNQITLQGTGAAKISVNNGTTNSLTLFGGLAVDPSTNQAFVVMSGSGQIDVVDLGPCSPAVSCLNPSNNLKPAEISDILVPTPVTNPPQPQGAIGGIPGATVPQGTLTSASDLTGVQIFGTGFDAQTSVRLDGLAIPSTDITFVNSRQLTVTIPKSFLSFPHRFALDLVNGSGSQSNATDFLVVQAVDMSQSCPTVLDANNNPVSPMPSSVAIADQLVNSAFAPIAVVSNINCNNIAVVDINPADAAGGSGPSPGAFGSILQFIPVGKNPQGVAISQALGLAVVANNGDGTASVVNLLTNAPITSVSTGTNPTGVGISDEIGAAIVTNTGSNTVTELNLNQLFGSSATTTLTPVSIGGFQQPTAVAIDPDRGTSNQGLAVVTGLQLVQGLPPSAELFPVDIGAATPVLSTTIPVGGAAAAPATGIVFDPTVVTGTPNPGVFYASSSGGNSITSYNPDSGTGGSVNVGINPTALAINPQTGAILTTNVAGKTTSIVDTTASPLKTVQTIGLPGSPQFGIAIDQFTNLAVIVDQGNNRLLLLSIPK